VRALLASIPLGLRRQHARRYLDSEIAGALEVEHDRVVERILDWQIAGFGATENLRALLARGTARATTFKDCAT
jgi:hypothetical protein